MTLVRTVLKLGGSVITHKDQPETVDEQSLGRACEAIAAFLSNERTTDGEEDKKDGEEGEHPEIILVHGGGSFGHHHAATHGISSTDGSGDAHDLVSIHRAMGDLNDFVLDALHDRDIDALPVRPLSVAHRDESGLQFHSGSVEAMLEEGFVPTTHGDVIVDSGMGGTILSGDDIVVSLARSLDADRVGLCSTVPGVLDDDGEVIPQIESYDEVATAVGESEATDVTGGMAHKVQQLLALDATASIFSVDALETFLEDGAAGTVVRGKHSQ